MPHYERPLTQAERAELARIRQNRQIRRARAQINDANYFSGAGKTLLAITLIVLGGGWPLLVWRKPAPDGEPSAAGWIALTIWIAFLAVIALLIYAAKQRARARRESTAAETTGVQETVSELRAQVLASNGVALSAIADPAMRERVAQIRATE
jgi:hypothetical protein